MVESENFVLKTTNQRDLKDVLQLQLQFKNENICNGINLDSIESLKQYDVFVSISNNKIVGYAFGKIQTEQKDKTYCRTGDKTFYIEEMFVEKDLRSKGHGKALYSFIEEYAKQHDCQNIQVVAVSKDYKKLLKFYIDELDFKFWSAWLVKNI